MVTPQPLLRFATFNVAMSADKPDYVFRLLREAHHPRFSRIAAIIQHCQPDVLLLCEFDHLGEGGDDGMLAHFQSHYLNVSQHGQPPISYPFQYLPPTNTGLALFDGEDISDTPERAQGFGKHHGQYGFVLLSKFPLDINNVRSWQRFLWQDMPEHRMPQDYFDHEVLAKQRLSSKNHVVIPVSVGEQTIHVVACHPTPPVFDGPEKRNLKRNADEIRLLHDILNNESYLVDDNGVVGGIAPNSSFVVMGDLNADPYNGDGDKSVITQLLADKNVQSMPTPSSYGAQHFIRGRYIHHKDCATHQRGLRLDYVLPSSNLRLCEGGVFWPAPSDPTFSLLTSNARKVRASSSSDHRLVWVDIGLI
ncbi:endonuclease/exonuclease/phosphatase family protein [Enterovibrio sp. ZSDZ42]|uniref:Endonuclease/exonuclease/phosphatase family protein n=1 Tax=Enterovibrio gelatinilyticus TaxID=2899819 RepID=A0ABT5R4B7_9GAMM|nr:endonuclease/exonuclease/phosphatase family protein [Enterovibrio sp. ZSDZ42]MDD1795127.1 endonuclease/exonuclease/phosphatase family protein [Enterovibrio sp. ZSDZ42]